MSPEYLTMFLYIIAWLVVRTFIINLARWSLTPETQRYIVYTALLLLIGLYMQYLVQF